jgi:transcriptional regulator with AAA-type ATPase domain
MYEALHRNKQTNKKNNNKTTKTTANPNVSQISMARNKTSHVLNSTVLPTDVC